MECHGSVPEEWNGSVLAFGCVRLGLKNRMERFYHVFGWRNGRVEWNGGKLIFFCLKS
jgi:hypothetical protein